MNEVEKAFNYLSDAITVNLPTSEIIRRAKLLIKAANEKSQEKSNG